MFKGLNPVQALCSGFSHTAAELRFPEHALHKAYDTAELRCHFVFASCEVCSVRNLHIIEHVLRRGQSGQLCDGWGQCQIVDARICASKLHREAAGKA